MDILPGLDVQNKGFVIPYVNGSNADILASGADDVVGTMKWDSEIVSKRITLTAIDPEYSYEVNLKLDKSFKIENITKKGPYVAIKDNGMYIIGSERYKITLNNANLYFS